MTSAPANPSPPPLLAVKDVSRTFCQGGSLPFGRTRTEVRAVRDVSFELHRGETLALVGESGCGKSTTARMIARLTAPTTGTISLAGASDVPDREYRSRVQMVFQDPFGSLNPAHTVRHHLTRPLLLHRRATRADLPEKVGALMDLVGLGRPLLDRHPHELSGGQRQRVAIARAFAVEPELVVADEPVSMLDVSLRLGVLALMEQLRTERGTAFLYITHDIASARHLGARILVMYAGQVVESGPAGPVVDRPAHPYTDLLIGSVPDPRRAAAPVKRARAGAAATGCPFAARCPLAVDRCRTEEPGATEVADGRWSRCHRAADQYAMSPEVTAV
ncbi:ABC transporter ATP-binding protein [Streptomyces sp. NPDC057499]|uniref:ABC transporter ATP-binding protein n=1 Tax=Streptomyces sp. NPDC057499 TaxID=3346150 RepID=UPI00368393AC